MVQVPRRERERPERRKGMRFQFDKGRAMKPVKVSWWLSATTVAGLEVMAKEEGVKVEEVAQQALDHALAGRPGKKQA
jgi:hypothetical protein